MCVWGGLGEDWQEARGMPHRPVVPDAFEEVQGLLQAVGLVVLPNDHVVAAAGHHEDNGSHICGTRKQKQCRSGDHGPERVRAERAYREEKAAAPYH